VNTRGVGAILALLLAARPVTGLAGGQEDEGRSTGSGDETPDVAADTPEAKAHAAAILNEGNALFEQKKYATALSKYESAYRIFPSPKILFNIAEAHRELGHSDEATTYYERFLKEANIDPGSPIHEKVTARLEALRSQAAYVAIDSDVSGAEVKIDGRSIGKTPLDRSVRVGAGTHEVTAEIVGYEPFRENIEVATGQTATVKLELTPSVVASARSERRDRGEAVRATTTPDEGEGVTSKWWFWAGIGAVVVAASVVVVVAASSHGNDFVPMGELGSSSTASWQRF
jgi:PEGA domain-containing protein/tetratricopeptide repeat protein